LCGAPSVEADRPEAITKTFLSRSKGCEPMHTLLRWTSPLGIGLLYVAVSLAASSSRAAVGTSPSAPQPAAITGGEKYALRYQYRVGEEIRSQVKNLATIETTISGSSQTTEMVSLSHKLWRITSVDKDGNVTFEHLVESVDMRNQMSGRQEVRYNSVTDKTAPPGYEDVAKSLGKPLTVATIDPWGNVLKREERQHTNLDNSGSVLLAPLPKEAVEIGHVWNLPGTVMIPLEDGSFKPIKTRQRYELQKVEDGLATIAVETQILTPVNNPKIRAQLIQRLWKGHLQFDIERGRMLSQRTDLDERVLGFSGPDSSMHYVARFTEQRLPDATKTAALPKPADAPRLDAPHTATPPIDTQETTPPPANDEPQSVKK
jgi:hypothetical protein